MIKQPSYFLVSLSNSENLELCMKFALAGFPNTLNGVWTFSDINEGDYISFLYGARVHNLYKVENKEALKNAKNLPPWRPIEFKVSRKTYYFPFRLNLSPIRKLDEPLVRMEFAYVAENLLLRGGYRKTHFQGDQTTLQNISQMGSIHEQTEKLRMPEYETFVPRFVRDRRLASPPEVYPLQEMILQAALRQLLSEGDKMELLLKLVGTEYLEVKTLEVLGEKALPEGHIDILIKEAVPIGLSKKIVLEVKMTSAQDKDIAQLKKYVDELGQECLGGVLIAGEFSKGIIHKIGEPQFANLHLLKYGLSDFSPNSPYTFDQLKERIQLESVSKWVRVSFTAKTPKRNTYYLVAKIDQTDEEFISQISHKFGKWSVVYNTINNRWWRLIPLCPHCRQEIDKVNFRCTQIDQGIINLDYQGNIDFDDVYCETETADITCPECGKVIIANLAGPYDNSIENFLKGNGGNSGR